MGILCRDHHEPHINADELIVRDSSGGNLLIKVDLISSDITLNGSKPSAGKWYVCMDLDGNVAVGYDLSDQDRANLPIECNVLQLYGKQLTFPLLISTQLKNSAKRASAVFERCSQLRQVLFAPDGIPFLVTDDMDRLGFDVLLDYCGVHPLTAHQLPSSEVPINPSLYLTAEDLQHARTDGVAMMDDATRINHKSYCKIRRVSGSATLSPLDTLHPHKILINGTNSSILCLEDFFMHIHSLTSEYLSDSHRCDYAKPDRIRYVLPDVSLMSAAHSRVSLSRLSSDHSKTVATELGTIKDVINAFANLLDGTVSTLYIDNRLNSLTGSEDVRKIGNCTSPNVDSSAADIYFDIDNDILPGPFVLPITTQMRLYVFLFVTSLEEQIWAEELVQSWKIMLDKDNSPNMFCCSSAYLNYIIAVMPAADASSRPSVYGMTSNEPSYRAVLVYLEQWLVEFGTAYDAVICLSGTNAISRFSPPGSDDSIIPPMIYGEPQTIKLSHPLVFAVSQTSLNVTETFNHIQSGLFVGMAKNVRIMIRQLRALAQTARTQLEYLQLGNALHYAMVSDQDLQFLIRVWVYHHLIVLGRKDIGIDLDYKYFVQYTSASVFKRNDAFENYYFNSSAITVIVDSLKDEFDDMRVQMTHLLGKPMTPDAYFTVDLNMYGSIIVEFNRHFFANCRVNIAIMIQLELFQYLFGSELFWDTVENLGSIVPSYPYCSHRPTIHEKKAAILILNAYYESIETSMTYVKVLEDAIHPFSNWTLFSASPLYRQNIIKMLKTIRGVQASLLLDIGNIDAARALYGLALPSVTPQSIDGNSFKFVDTSPPYPLYHVVMAAREDWFAQKKHLFIDYSSAVNKNMSIKCIPTTHYVTFATAVKDGLVDLLVSAKFSGIDVKVLGIGEHFHSFVRKMRGYQQFLSGNANVSIQPCDVVVLMDAYDVLLSPAARFISQTLATFDTPIVFCGEHGIYPNYITASFDRRNDEDPLTYGVMNATGCSDNEEPLPRLRNHNMQRFLNSGIIVGVASELREMYDYILEIHSSEQLQYKREINYFADDQHAFTQYALVNPHKVSIDTGKKMFYSLYKEETLLRVWVKSNFSIFFNSLYSDKLAAVHCNGGTKKFCNVIASTMRELYQGLYAGELDGPLLHKAMLAIWDRHFDLAYALLHDPLVLHTLNENGALRDVLLENLEHAMHAV